MIIGTVVRMGRLSLDGDTWEAAILVECDKGDLRNMAENMYGKTVSVSITQLPPVDEKGAK